MEDLAAYEGLVGKTARMYARMVGLEYEDLRQELYVKVIKAQRAYSPERSKMPEQRFVFGCLMNFVKDLKAAAARRARMPIDHIEDFAGEDGLDWFEARYLPPAPDELDRFPMPATITEAEANLIVLLILGFQQIEAARMLGVSKTVVAANLKVIQIKFADWRPAGGKLEPAGNARPASTHPPARPAPPPPAPPTALPAPVAPAAAAA